MSAGRDQCRHVTDDGIAGLCLRRYRKIRFVSLFHETMKEYTLMRRFVKHAARKRRFADRFAMTNILRPEVLGGIQEKALKVTKYCEKAGGKALDAYVSDFVDQQSKWFNNAQVILHCYALDCVSHHLFSPGGLDSLNNPDDRALMEELCTDNSLQGKDYVSLQIYGKSANNHQHECYNTTLHKPPT